jgi:hypothetical protein
MWLPVTASRHAGLDPASSLKRDASQPLINPDSDKNFGNEYSGAGVPACDSPLDFPSKAVHGGQGRPPHYCEQITLSQNPAPIIEHPCPVGADPRVCPISADCQWQAGTPTVLNISPYLKTPIWAA